MKNPKKILIPLAGALCLSATLTSAMAAAFPVTIHALSSSQREELEERGQVGTAYLAQNNETGTNGSLCAPFTARSTGAAFALAKLHFIDRFDGGESMLQLAARIYALLDELRGQDGPVLLVAHNGIARVVQSYFHDMTNEQFALFGIANCELRRYDFST